MDSQDGKLCDQSDSHPPLSTIRNLPGRLPFDCRSQKPFAPGYLLIELIASSEAMANEPSRQTIGIEEAALNLKSH